MNTPKPDVVWRIVPAPGRVAVKVVGTSGKIGSLFIPDTVHDKPTQGEVIAVSAPYEYDGTQYDPIYPVGTTVIFGKYTGTVIEWGQPGDRPSKVIVLRERDIVASFIREETGNVDTATLRTVRVTERD